MPTLALLALLSVLAKSCGGDPIDNLFSKYGGTNPGASIAVVKDGAILVERNYGLANLATGEHTSATTNFRLASMTKQFTATAILILADKGKLKIDDTVAKFLPELAPVCPATTLRQLLTHTSGLPDYERLLGDDKTATKQLSDRDVLALVVKNNAAPVPGRYHYNNTGYALLALVVERVGKVSFADFMQKNIFQPLNMTATIMYKPDAAIAQRALGYSEDQDKFELADQNRTTAVLGDGGVYSSVADLAHWVDALDKHTLLSETRFADQTTPHVTTNDPGVQYGYGFRIDQLHGQRIVFHTGTTSGFKNALVWVPAKKLAVIVLTNRRQGDTLTLAKLVLDEYWDK